MSTLRAYGLDSSQAHLKRMGALLRPGLSFCSPSCRAANVRRSSIGRSSTYCRLGKPDMYVFASIAPPVPGMESAYPSKNQRNSVCATASLHAHLCANSRASAHVPDTASLDDIILVATADGSNTAAAVSGPIRQGMCLATLRNGPALHRRHEGCSGLVLCYARSSGGCRFCLPEGNETRLDSQCARIAPQVLEVLLREVRRPTLAAMFLRALQEGGQMPTDLPSDSPMVLLQREVWRYAVALAHVFESERYGAAVCPH